MKNVSKLYSYSRTREKKKRSWSWGKNLQSSQLHFVYSPSIVEEDFFSPGKQRKNEKDEHTLQTTIEFYGFIVCALTLYHIKFVCFSLFKWAREIWSRSKWCWHVGTWCHWVTWTQPLNVSIFTDSFILTPLYRHRLLLLVPGKTRIAAFMCCYSDRDSK
jgi:hypothetical protein